MATRMLSSSRHQPLQDVFFRKAKRVSELNRWLDSHIEEHPDKIRACEGDIEKIRVKLQ